LFIGGKAGIWRWVAPLIALIAVALLFSMRVNSDELQHAHVVWLWTKGQVAYRDFFDNHTQLFHLFMVPVFWAGEALFGESVEIFLFLRFAGLVFFLAVLIALHLLAGKIASTAVARWAVVLFAALPFTLMRSVEFRPDTLWNALWLFALALLVSSGRRDRTWALAGLCFGLAVLVSIKTVVLLASAILAGCILFTAMGSAERPRASEILRPAIRFSIYFLTPLLCAGWVFSALGAREALISCLITHNSDAALALRHDKTILRLLLPILLPCFWYLTRISILRSTDPKNTQRSAFVYLSGALFLLALIGYSPIIDSQTLLPGISIGVLGLAHALKGYEIALKVFSVIGFLSLPLAPGIKPARLWERLRQNATVLQITTPDEFVLSQKGEIFMRKRPVYAVYERVTRARIDAGKQEEEIPELLPVRPTAVVLRGKYSPEAEAFLRKNYLQTSIGLSFIGFRIIPAAQVRAASFEISIPGEYTFLTSRGVIEGRVDGFPLKDRVGLDKGPHSVEWEGEEPPCLVVWERAFRAGLIDQNYCAAGFDDPGFYQQ